MIEVSLLEFDAYDTTAGEKWWHRNDFKRLIPSEYIFICHGQCFFLDPIIELMKKAKIRSEFSVKECARSGHTRKQIEYLPLQALVQHRWSSVKSMTKEKSKENFAKREFLSQWTPRELYISLTGSRTPVSRALSIDKRKSWPLDHQRCLLSKIAIW